MIPIGRSVLFKFRDKKIYKEGKIAAYPAEGIIQISKLDSSGFMQLDNTFIVKLDEIDLIEQQDD